jgi:hypothetical protein
MKRVIDGDKLLEWLDKKCIYSQELSKQRGENYAQCIGEAWAFKSVETIIKYGAFDLVDKKEGEE